MSTVTITKARLEELERAEELLSALEAGGVDNWEWYHESTAHLYADEDEDETSKDIK